MKLMTMPQQRKAMQERAAVRTITGYVPEDMDNAGRAAHDADTLLRLLSHLADYACPGTDYTWRGIMERPSRAPHSHMADTAKRLYAALEGQEMP